MDGFLGTRAPLFPDVVVASLAAVVPLLLTGVVLAKRGRTAAHKTVMFATYHVLLAVVIAFVVWNAVAGTTVDGLEEAWFYRSFYLPFIAGHVVLAVFTVLFAGWVTWRAIRRRSEGADGQPSFDPKETGHHRRTGWVAVVLLVLTAASGLVIYWIRYVHDYGG